jgi:arylsulfatase A-like enzyme
MKKNLIFIHLESLNQAIFSRRQWFPCINSIVPHCLRLNNFTSSATSSIMAVSDLLHGDDNVLEHNKNLEQGITIHPQSSTLFDELNTAGYNTAGLGFPKSWGSVDNIWSKNDGFHWYDHSAQMLQHAEALIADDTKPFAMYIWNLSSHLCYADNYKAASENSFQRWQRGYESMDNTVGDILRLLMDKKKMENTILVIFGDHGDDFWNHGVYGGFSHAIEPYTSLVHTPAFIFDSRKKARDINHLVSMVDLKRTTLELLDLPYQATSTLAYNALSGDRKYSFSRNLFAAQAGETPTNPLQKGYAITSDLFHLVLVNNEYKMFAWQADSSNQFNLLEFLATTTNGRPAIDYARLSKGRPSGPHPHLGSFLAPGCEDLIYSSFIAMKKELEKWLTEKNKFI